MNEMNNGENNNQNIEQQNMNQNNVVEPVQQQYVQPKQPVNETPKKEEKKSYCGLLVVFMIISLLLAGFIIYDKVIKADEPNIINDKTNCQVEKNVRELAKFDDSQFSEQDNVRYNDRDYLKVLTYKNNDLTIDFRIYFDLITQDTSIGYKKGQTRARFYINGVYMYEVINFEEEYCLSGNPKCFEKYGNLEEVFGTRDSIESSVSEVVDLLKSTFGTIKGDKYYLYMKNDGINTAYGTAFIFINEEGKILSSDIETIYPPYLTADISFSNDCKLFQYFEKEEDDPETMRRGRYYIGEDSIYYFNVHGQDPDYDICYDKTTYKMSSVCEHYLTDEYKITINNNKVINEKVNACYVDMSPLYG